MPSTNDGYGDSPTLIDLAREADKEFVCLKTEIHRLTEENKRLEKENSKLRELLMTKVMDFVK